MPKYLDGYQTTLGSRVPTNKLSDTLNVSMIRDNLLTSSLDVKKIGSVYPVFVTSAHDTEDSIPLFAHPYLFTTRAGQRTLVTDIRLFLKKKVFDGTLASLPTSIASQVDFSFTRTRAILNLEWIEGDVESMKTDLHFSTAVFGRWIADALTRAFALDPRDQLLIAIACSYYYQALFVDASDRESIRGNEETLQKWSIHTMKVTHADATTTRFVFDRMPDIKSVESLIEGIQLVTDNIRLKSLNLVFLLTQLKNSWYGTNSKEILAVSLEHPPTWMAIVYGSMKERSYRSSQIYKIAERVSKRGVGDEYLKNCQTLLSEHTVSSAHSSLAYAGLV